MVLRFLDDYADTLRLGVLDAFYGGELTALLEHEARGRILMCDELADLHWEQVLALYNAAPVATEEPQE